MSKAPAISDSKTGRLRTARIGLNSYPYTASIDPQTGDYYVGGEFTNSTSEGWVQSFVEASSTTGSPVKASPLIIDGPYYGGGIYQIINNGDGTYFICGNFSHINGLERRGLAKVSLDGTVYDWNPNTNASVEWMGIIGSVMYFGGSFTTVGGVARNKLAAVSTTGTGAVTSWAPVVLGPSDSTTNMNCNAGLVIGNIIYIGGRMGKVNGTVRLNAAAIDTAGTLQSWNPLIGSDDYNNRIVYKMMNVGSVIYFGGDFYQIGGTTARAGACAVDTAGTIQSWNPNLDNNGNIRYCYDLAYVASNSTIYYVGNFTTSAGVSRQGIGAMNTSGTLQSFNPTVNWEYAGYYDMSYIETDGSSLFIFGYFSGIGGVTKNRCAKIDLAGNLISAWNPNSNFGPVTGLVSLSNGNTLLVGSGFFGGDKRAYLLGVKANGSLSTLNLPVSGTVYTTMVDGDILYIGGAFATVGGVARANFAAINIRTNTLTSLNISPNGAVNKIIKHGASIYIAGGFTTVAAQTRNYAAAIDTSGNLQAWNPNLNSSVEDIFVNELDSVIYIGGNFTTVNGGTSILRLVAVNNTDGTKISSWTNPNINSTVKGITVTGSNVYICGFFTTVNAVSRVAIASLDKNTGALNSWTATFDNSAFCIASNGNYVALGGYFQVVNSVPASGFVVLNATTGAIIEGSKQMNTVPMPVLGKGLFSVENGIAQVKKPTADGLDILRIFDTRYEKRRN